MTFRAFIHGEREYRRIGDKPANIRVRGATRPSSAAFFVAAYHAYGAALVARDDQVTDEVPILGKGGCFARGGRDYVVSLLSTDEERLLKLFGVDLRPVGSRTKKRSRGK